MRHFCGSPMFVDGQPEVRSYALKRLIGRPRSSGRDWYGSPVPYEPRNMQLLASGKTLGRARVSIDVVCASCGSYVVADS